MSGQQARYGVTEKGLLSIEDPSVGVASDDIDGIVGAGSTMRSPVNGGIIGFDAGVAGETAAARSSGAAGAASTVVGTIAARADGVTSACAGAADAVVVTAGREPVAEEAAAAVPAKGGLGF